MKSAIIRILVSLLTISMVLLQPVVSFSTTTTTAPLRQQQSSFPLLSARKDDINDDDDGIWTDESDSKDLQRRDFLINAAALGLLGASGVASASLFQTSVYTPSGFKRISPIQFVAALGDPKSSSGTGAEQWGLWQQDPGPRGVWLKQYENELVSNKGIAPAGWKFDLNDWWLEEHGLIMEAPKFPLSPGRYLVTGGRLVTTGLTVNRDGSWSLDEGTLFDVTHLPCRSARYTPKPGENGSPLTANPRNFPVSTA
jgi:hypothetical protein